MSCCGGGFYNNPNAVVVPLGGCNYTVSIDPGFVDGRLVGPIVSLQEWQEKVHAFNTASRRASPCEPIPCCIFLCCVVVGFALFIPMMALFYDVGSVVCDLPNGICKANQDPVDNDCCSFWCCPARVNIPTVPTNITYPLTNSTRLQLFESSYSDMQCSELSGEHTN
eukprot:1190451-Prorocentrum_minimum.AAC.1